MTDQPDDLGYTAEWTAPEGTTAAVVPPRPEDVEVTCSGGIQLPKIGAGDGS